MTSIRGSMLNTILTAAIAAALVLPASALVAQQPSATFQRAITAYRNARSISVKFDQVVSNPLTDHSLTTHGELRRKQPNLLSISFDGADPDRIVADGSSLWVYLPSTAPGQVIRVPAAAGESGMLVDPMGQILSAPADSYAIADAGATTVAGRATHAITLTPHSRNALFTTATLWLDDADGLVRRIESTEPSGLERRITITRFQTNVAIPVSAFRFTPPPNVRVVDGSSMVTG